MEAPSGMQAPHRRSAGPYVRCVEADSADPGWWCQMTIPECTGFLGCRVWDGLEFRDCRLILFGVPLGF